jgi:hypothetical protein
MIQISLTDFVDFASKSGSPKQTKVQQLKNREAYHPAMDFWKPLREKIIEMHQNSENKTVLDDLMDEALHKTKLENYPDAIKGYKKFLGRKNIDWFDPPASNWEYSDLEIKINPEAGLLIEGTPYLIKYHFKKEPLAKNRAQAIIKLMELSLFEDCPDGCEFAVLDVQRSNLLTKDRRISDITPLLNAEANSFISLWNQL